MWLRRDFRGSGIGGEGFFKETSSARESGATAFFKETSTALGLGAMVFGFPEASRAPPSRSPEAD